MNNNSEIMKEMHKVLDRDAKIQNYIESLKTRIYQCKPSITINDWEYNYLLDLIKYWER